MMSRLAVYGNGIAAQAVTRLLCEHGFGVTLICPNGVSKMESAIYQAFEKSAQEKSTFLFPDDLKYELAYIDRHMSQLRFGDNLWSLADCPAVLFEMFEEHLDGKRQAVRQVRTACPEAIIASNSEDQRFSTIFADLLADRRLIGTHFVPPIGVSRHIELVPTNATSTMTIMTMKALAVDMGMTVAVCEEANPMVPGYREKENPSPLKMLDTVIQSVEGSIGGELIRKLNGAV